MPLIREDPLPKQAEEENRGWGTDWAPLVAWKMAVTAEVAVSETQSNKQHECPLPQLSDSR